MFYFLNDNGVAIQAISSIILVCITAYYAVYTKRIVAQAVLQRQEWLMPAIVVEKFVVNTNSHKDFYCIEVYIKNIGNGVALNPLVKFYDGETGDFIMKSKHLIEPIEKGLLINTHIHISTDGFNHIRYQSGPEENSVVSVLNGVIEFNDIIGNKYSAEQSYSFNKKTGEIKPILGRYRLTKDGKPLI